MIYTNNNNFTADNIFSVAVARLAGLGSAVERVEELPKTFNSSLDVAIDIGGEYNSEKMIFDHKFQNGSDDGMATIGKLWENYGIELCSLSKNDPNGLRVAQRVYLTLLKSIDKEKIGIKYYWKDGDPITVSMFIELMNVSSNSSKQEVDDAFKIVVKAAENVLLNSISNARSYIKMSKVVENAVRHFDGKVLEIGHPGSWQEHIHHLLLDDCLYVIYPSDSSNGYIIESVLDNLDNFKMRKPMPESWNNLKGQDFANLTGLSECGSSTFSYPGQCIAGAENKNDILKLAKLAVFS